MEKFWNCFVEGTTGGCHTKHATLQDAREEARRLARLPENRDRKVYVLELVGYYEVTEVPVEWHEVES
mgnify:CR=1 FL=1